VAPRLFALLEEISVDLKAAQRSVVGGGDELESDHAIHRVRMALAEAFLIPDIGQGLSSSIALMYSACAHFRGELFTHEQIKVLQDTIAELRRTPFLDDNQAADICNTLADVGLEVVPPELQNLPL